MLLISNVLALNWCMTTADLVIWQRFGDNTISNGSLGPCSGCMLNGSGREFPFTHLAGQQGNRLSQCFYLISTF